MGLAGDTKIIEMNTQQRNPEPIAKTILYHGYEIHYSMSGVGKEQLMVLLHPAFSDQNAFPDQMAAFAKNYAVLTVDLIGHGLSKVKNTTHRLDITPEHIAAIIKQEGYKQAHIVGVSMGALMAQYFAYTFPEQTLSLTGMGGYSIHEENKEVAKAQMASNITLILRALFSLNSFRNKVAQMTCYTRQGQELFQATMAGFERKTFRYMSGLQHVIKNRPDFKATYPVLILIGEHDIALAHKMAKQWQEAVPHSQYHEISGGGHCAQLDQPEFFNKRVLEFVDGIN